MEPINPEVTTRLDELAASAATSDSGAAFMSPDGAPKVERRGRKKGSKNKPKDGSAPEVSDTPKPPDAEAQIEANKQFLQPVFEMLSIAGVKVAGNEKAAIGPTEMVVIVDSASRCVHQYLPAVVGNHTNLLIFSLAMSSWGFRVYALREQSIDEIRKERAASGLPESGTSGT